MGTLQQDTVQNVLQIISDYRDENNTNTDAKRIRAVSRVERDFANRRYWDIFLLPNQTATGDSTNTYELGTATNPARDKGLFEVFVGGTGEEHRHAIVDFNRFKNLYNNSPAVKAVYQWYDSANDVWKMHINPAPETGAVITYSYFWTPPKRTSTSDVLVCYDMRILANLALGELYEAEDEGDKADVVLNKAEQLVGEYEGKQITPAVNQLYTFGSINNQITQKPIGSY